MAERLCPVCNGPMWSAADSKYPQKAGAPDFRCKDKECRYALNKETGEYEPSEYTTGLWLPKVKKVAPKAAVAAGKTTPETAKKEMLISYAKDIVCAEIAKGIEVKEPFKRVADGFKALMMAYTHPFGKPVSPKPAPEPEPDVDDGADEPNGPDNGGEDLPF